jgi:peptidoglycan hydrolase-like protein with peptidoglycan-binding domain
MTLPPTPNKKIPSALRQGDEGWPVFGLQTGLDSLGYNLAADGDFGPKTESATKKFQKDNKLTADGIAGSATMGRMVALIDAKTHDKHSKLPSGLLRGFSETEGGNNLGAVNWSVSGGVDCGVVQIRCYGPPYAVDALYTAYNPAVAMDKTAVIFQGRLASYRQMRFAKSQPLEFAQRCAALSWNWPYGADQYAKIGKLPNPYKDATWAVIDGKRVRFPDGSPVMTYKDWAEFYAMGGKHGEGRVTRYVRW